MRSSVVVLEHKTRAMTLSERNDDGFHNVVPVVDPCHVALAHMEISSVVHGDPCPHHNTASSIAVVRNHGHISMTFSTTPPNPNSAIIEVKREPRLVREHNRAPLLHGPADVTSTPCSPCLPVVKSQWQNNCGSASVKLSVVKAVSHSLCGDSSASDLTKALLESSCILGPVSEGLNHNQSILAISCGSRTTTSGQISNCPIVSVAVP